MPPHADSPADSLEELDARMAEPGYQPILARPSVIAKMFKVTPAAVSNWAARPDTGVHRYGREYDVNACARWILRRNEAKNTRGRT